MTTDSRSVIVAAQRHARADGRDQASLQDLAAALAVPRGNTAGLWSTAPAAPRDERPTAEAPQLDDPLRPVLEQAVQVALRQRAPHVATEHVLSALVRTGPADVVTWLADRGATVEAVDSLLTGLGTGPGVEQLPAEPSPAEQQSWQRAMEQAAKQPAKFPTATVVVVAVIAIALFALCIWGP